MFRTCDQGSQFPPRNFKRDMLEAAFGSEQQPVRRKVLQRRLRSPGNLLHRFDLVAALIDDTDRKLTAEVEQAPELHHVVAKSTVFQTKLIHTRGAESISELVISRRVGVFPVRIAAAHMRVRQNRLVRRVRLPEPKNASRTLGVVTWADRENHNSPPALAQADAPAVVRARVNANSVGG